MNNSNVYKLFLRSSPEALQVFECLLEQRHSVYPLEIHGMTKIDTDLIECSLTQGIQCGVLEQRLVKVPETICAVVRYYRMHPDLSRDEVKIVLEEVCLVNKVLQNS